ncbi:MAG: PIN domain-containing protein [Saprospiraceae bacterium]|nr:PIN domain-containing protein [Saprospiraceae bacterium]
MPDKCFFDTNLWVYLKAQNQSPDDLRKQEIVSQLILDLPEIVLSVQVLNELSNVLMKKFSFTEAAIENYVDEICGEFEVSNLSPTITKSALNLKSRYGISWFDSLIVAAALSAKCTLLYTEDLHDGMVFEGRLKVVNPFK